MVLVAGRGRGRGTWPMNCARRCRPSRLLDILRDEFGEGRLTSYRSERGTPMRNDLAQTVENVMDFSVADAMAEPALKRLSIHSYRRDFFPVPMHRNDFEGS